ncbi:GAF domain-containing protein [Paenimyroides tangerinum]|uniref:GAF domain-containing protein n=1 Tax=Paenimyroides tangerinum TaxID=2488728 RepID=A0A3P3W932_9FLAO|nr:GAF domain-containing protein [Paenimyroides tangerinum]RRJ90129.1 GAF domain-containing protein [Paenimyroides tangerinum]
MNVDYFEESPYYSVISFHKVIEALQEIANEDGAKYRVEYAKSLLEEVAKVPELYSGITSKKTINENADLIHNLLADLFPTVLTNNEIKAVSLPFHNFNFNFTKRFQQILANAGESFEVNIRDFDSDDFYILSCCLILNSHYNENLDISRPLFYDIPDKDGILKHYRITYNADFVEIIPTENAIPITEDDIKLLKNNYDNIQIWKEKFPKHSWILKGFGIITLFDVTIENSISILKSNLIKSDSENNLMEIIQRSFQSIFKISNLKVGIVFLNNSIDGFFEMSRNVNISSFFNYPELDENPKLKLQSILLFKEAIKAPEFYCVSDIDDLIANPEFSLYASLLKSKNIESFILAKLNKVDTFQGFIEVVSDKKYGLHSVNSKKINSVLPFINDTVDRIDSDIKYQFEAIIQREFTTIHPSVYWKFLEEAKNYFRFATENTNYVFNEIEFDSVYPLFGETDIKGSTYLRNIATRNDIENQLNELINMFDYARKLSSNLLFEQRFTELNSYKNDFLDDLNTYTEFQIQNYINQNIHPVLKKFDEYELMQPLVLSYAKKLDQTLTKYCPSRSKYDAAIIKINKNLAEVIDASQNKIQHVFPHYFERFKSDGIEHNAYIGSSISPDLIYDNLYLYNLRLWQIQTMCEMVRNHYTLNAELEIELTSLILVYNYPINIRFRFDEKRFDVASSSDVRFQMIKKRIDKANIKDKDERIVKPRFLTIVYLNENDKLEYLRYLKFLIQKQLFIGEIADIEIEDLQDISRLRALRIQINIEENIENKTYYSYSDLS